MGSNENGDDGGHRVTECSTNIGENARKKLGYSALDCISINHLCDVYLISTAVTMANSTLTFVTLKLCYQSIQLQSGSAEPEGTGSVFVSD